MIFWTQIPSPVGPLVLAASDVGLHALEFAAPRHPVRRGASWREAESPQAHPILHRAQEQLQDYFAGTRRVFDLPLAPQGTAFQRQVWLTLASIPYGQTISYAELAVRVARPLASRAVGGANGRNPISIILPCHRVIGADGSLTGYGGGLAVKEFLLRLEGVAFPGSESEPEPDNWFEPELRKVA